MQHASAEAPTQEFTAPVASVSELDRRPWPVRIRTAAAATNLPPVTRCFAVTIATFFGKSGRWAMSPEQISEATGHSRAQVFEHLSRCKREGLIAVKSGRGLRRSTYSAGSAIIGTPAAETTQATVRSTDKTVRDTGPLSIRDTDSGSQVRTSSLHSTLGTQPNRGKRPQRDDERRFTCGMCKRTWPAKYGEKCHGCRGRAIEAINADIAAQARIDRKQAARLEPEIANRPCTCRRCGNRDARRGDMADTGRCAVCVPLADDEAAALRRKGEPLQQELVQAWKDRDHVRGKAAAQELVELYGSHRRAA